jgi:hypothetical protein
MSAANRGKYTEDKVREVLKAIECDHLRFTFNRIPDAHAAGGKAQPQAGDFQAFYKDMFGGSWNFLIEAKETEHPSRLPYKNFSPDAVARAYKRQLAGSQTIVLVCSKPTKEWRLIPLDFFRERNAATPSGSWVFSGFPAFTTKQLHDVLLKEFGI